VGVSPLSLFPLTVGAFEGNKAETATMLPMINSSTAAHRLSDVTVVADAGLISEGNQAAIGAGLSLFVGTRITHVPDVVRRWRDSHPGLEVPDGQVFTQPWPATAAEKARGGIRIPDRAAKPASKGPGARPRTACRSDWPPEGSRSRKAVGRLTFCGSRPTPGQRSCTAHHTMISDLVSLAAAWCSG